MSVNIDNVMKYSKLEANKTKLPKKKKQTPVDTIKNTFGLNRSVQPTIQSTSQNILLPSSGRTDAQVYGTFSNGYQPKGISGHGALSKSGQYINVATGKKQVSELSGKEMDVTNRQNVWKAEDGSLWYWNGQNRTYVPYDNQNTGGLYQDMDKQESMNVPVERGITEQQRNRLNEFNKLSTQEKAKVLDQLGIEPSEGNVIDKANSARIRDAQRKEMAGIGETFSEKEFVKNIGKASAEFGKNILQKPERFEDGYDFGDVTKTILGTTGDIGLNITKGVVQVGEGAVNLGKAELALLADGFQNYEFADKLRNQIKDNPNALTKLLEEAQEDVDYSSIIGKSGDQILQGIGYTATLGGAQMLGGSALMNLLTFSSATGSGYAEAMQKEGANNAQIWAKAISSGSVETLTENLFGLFGKTGLDDAIANSLSKKASSAIGKALTRNGIMMGSEASEEIISAVLNHYMDKALVDNLDGGDGVKFAEKLDWEQITQEALSAGLSAGLTGAGGNIRATSQIARDNNISMGEALTQYENELDEKSNREILREQYKDLLNKELRNNKKLLKTTTEESAKEKIQDDIDVLQNELNRINEQENEAPKLPRKGLTTQAQQTTQESTQTAENATSEPTREIGKNLLQSIEDYNNSRSEEQEIFDLNNEETKKEIEAIQKIADDRGIEITFDANEFNDNVRNAFYDYDDNGKLARIVLNPNTATRKYAQNLAIHELLHSFSGNKKENLMKEVLNYAKTLDGFEEGYLVLEEAYKEHYGENVSKDVINEEVVANLLGARLGSKEFVEDLINGKYATQNRKWTTRLYEFVKNQINRFRGYKDQVQYWKHVKELFDDAYRKSEINKGQAYSADAIKMTTTRDSEGNHLSKGQVEYFKDSKVRDSEGNLLRVYHGTEANVGIPREYWFSIFDEGRQGDNGSWFGNGFYFTSNRESAQDYAHSKGNVYETYLNITNPYIPYSSGNSMISFQEDFKNNFEEARQIEGNLNGRQIQDILKKNGYDGIIIGDDYIAFNSNQIKNIDNLNPTSDPDIRYSFGGSNAVTANIKTLREAKKLKKQGLSNEEIYQQTGWFIGNEGKWRFEIDNSEDIIDFNFKDLEDFYRRPTTRAYDSYGLSLQSVLKSDELYKAYPQLKNIVLEFNPSDTSKALAYVELIYKNGEYQPSNSIKVTKDGIDSIKAEPDKLKSYLLHELQHHIQSIEGFSKGADFKEWYEYKTSEIKKKLNNIINKYISKELRKNNAERIWDVQDSYIRNSLYEMESIAGKSMNQYLKDPESFELNYVQKRGLESILGEKQTQKFYEILDEMKDYRDYGKALELYKNTAGEIEARQVQERMDWSPEERKAKIPFIKDENTVYSEEMRGKAKRKNERQYSVDTRNDGTLLAIHNLTADKLQGVLELDGFPVPSIAITNQPHTQFGDISVIFDKNTIDPANIENEVYDRDVWSPTFPRVDYDISNSDIKKYVSKDLDLYSRDDIINRAVTTYFYDTNLLDKIDSRGVDGTLEAIKNSKEMKYLYLNKIAKEEFKPIMKQAEFSNSSDYGNEQLQEFLDWYKGTPLNELSFDEKMALGEKISELVKKRTEEDLNKDLPNGMKEYIKNFAVEIAKNYKENFGKIDNFIYSAISMQRNGSDYQVIDQQKTLDNVDNVINQKEYEEWVDSTFGELFKNTRKGIRNKKDTYTSSGNRRSFDALHDEYSLSNLVKAMVAERTTGVDNFSVSGFGSIQAKRAKQFKSIQDIKNNEDLLTSSELTPDILEPLKDSIVEDIEILSKYYNSSGYTSGFDNSANAISEFAEKKNLTPEAFKKVLKSYYNFDVDNIPSDFIQEVIRDLHSLENIQTDYFEAKPQRAVGLDEVKAIVIPNNLDANLRQQLEDRGIKLVEYDPNIEGDREAKLKSAELQNLRFSKDTSGAWDDFVQKYFKTEGTGTAIRDMKKLPVKTYSMEDVRSVLDEATNIPAEEKTTLGTYLEGQTITKDMFEDFKKTIQEIDNNYKEAQTEATEETAEDTPPAWEDLYLYDLQSEETPVFQKEKKKPTTRETQRKSQPEIDTSNTQGDILDTTKTYKTGRKQTYVKYLRDGSNYDRSALERAMGAIPGKQGRRTKDQWLLIARQMGTEIADRTDAEIEKIAYRTWLDEAPNQKSQLNRQGEKFVKFNSDDWINAVYNQVKDVRQRFSVETNEQTTETDNTLKNDIDNFSKQVDDVLSGKFPQKDMLVVLSKTPQPLLDIGLNNYPITLTQNHLKSIVNKTGNNTNVNYHGLGADLIKQLPEALNNPLDILESSTRDDSVVLTTYLSDNQNRTIVASIKIDGKGRINDLIIDSNVMTSAYGRNNYEGWMNKNIDEGKLLYDVDRGVIKKVDMARLQLPRDIDNVDKVDNLSTTNDIISQNDNNVKLPPASENIEGKSRKHYRTYSNSESLSKKDQNLAKELYREEKYIPIGNVQTLTQANSRIERNGLDSVFIELKNNFNDSKKMTLDDIVTMERMIQMYSAKGDSAKVNRLMQQVAIVGTELGQRVQALSIIRKMSPEGQLQMLQRLVKRTNQKENSDLKISDEQADRILRSNGEKELNDNVTKVVEELAQELNVSFGDEIRAWRYLSMLGNPRTHVRNILGNVAMNVLQNAKNKVAGAGEDLASLINPNLERTKTLRKANEDQRAFAKQDALAMEDMIDGGGKYDMKNIMQNAKRTSNLKVLNAVENFNSFLLDKEDKIFLKKAYEQAMRNYMSANRLSSKDMENTAVLEKARQEATLQAQEATFHQYSALARLLSQIEQNHKYGGAFISAILPFKKTPINIAKTGMQYSPIGIVGSVGSMIKNVAKDTKTLRTQLQDGKITQEQYNSEISSMVNKRIDQMAKGLTGTAVALLGYVLAKQGILKAGNGDDEDEFEEKLGKQTYSITIGDNNFSLDWLAPSAIPLFVGANFSYLANGDEESPEGETAYDRLGRTLNTSVTSLAQAFEPMTEMSMLQGLASAMSSYEQDSTNKWFDIGTSAIQSYAGQFVPTALGQVAKTIDPVVRDTTSTKKGLAKKLDQLKNQTMSKIPGVSMLLPAKTNVWGEEKRRPENVILRLLENAVLPYNREKIIEDATSEKLKDVYEETGAKGALPGSVQKYVTINKQRYNLNNTEFNSAKKVYGQTAKKMLDKVIDDSRFKDLDSDAQLKMIQDIYLYSKEEFKLKYAEDNDIDYTAKVNNSAKKYNMLKEYEEDETSLKELINQYYGD